MCLFYFDFLVIGDANKFQVKIDYEKERKNDFLKDSLTWKIHLAERDMSSMILQRSFVNKNL